MFRNTLLSFAVNVLVATAAVAWLAATPAHSSATDSQDRHKHVLDVTDAARADRVNSLPGWGTIEDFDLFAGYITVSQNAGRALFYVLAAARTDPETAPLILWLNGGPGCSSIGGGFMSELGPFYPSPDGTCLEENAYAWNGFANVLFVESPAFVGFSYSNTSSDVYVGDKRTAADLRIFLLGFFDRFPTLRHRPFWISGESYAGHYVPQLAEAVHEGNLDAGGPRSEINLAGIMVGNPWTDPGVDNLGAVDFWWAHSLVGDETAEGIRGNCNFSHVGPLREKQQGDGSSPSKDELCDDFCSKAFDDLRGINIYEIYADVCFRSSLSSSSSSAAAASASATRQAGGGSGGGNARLRGQAEALAQVLGDHPASLAVRMALTEPSPSRSSAEASSRQQSSRRALTGTIKAAAAADRLGKGYDPCVDYEVQTYLNQPEVQRALHANISGRVPGPWTDCSRIVEYSRRDVLSSVVPVYERLLAGSADLDILIYSGDVDGIVPVVGTRRWTSSLKLPVIIPWGPWRSTTDQVGGYAIHYDGLVFSSVRNAGHMVPYTQPERAYHMAKHFVFEGELV